MNYSLANKLGLTLKVLFATSVLAAVVPSAASAAPTLMKESTLSVGSDLTYPPFAYLKENKPAGFDVELMELIAKQMELDPAFVDTRFASLITGLRAGHFDAIASALYVTPERAKVVNFIPYIKAGSSLLVLADATYRPEKEQDLCGKIIGSMQGASWLPKLKKFSDEYCLKNNLGPIETREYDTDAQVTQALRSRVIDVEFMDNVVGAELLRKFPKDYAVTSQGLIYPIMVGIAVNPQNKELLKALNAAFTEVRKSGSYDELITKYDMQPVTDEEIATIVNAVN